MAVISGLVAALAATFIFPEWSRGTGMAVAFGGALFGVIYVLLIRKPQPKHRLLLAESRNSSARVLNDCL